MKWVKSTIEMHRKVEIRFGKGVREFIWKMVNANNKNDTKCRWMLN